MTGLRKPELTKGLRLLRLPELRGIGTERGSVTILVAVVILLGGVLALASVDVLRALEAKARAQTAADAAALAAAQEMVVSSFNDPATAAADYAQRNGAVLLACDCPAGGSQAVVHVEVRVRLVFVGSDRTVSGRARAVVEGR
jgi:secretion/DNA translocation related TadE-like protein